MSQVQMYIKVNEQLLAHFSYFSFLIAKPFGDMQQIKCQKIKNAFVVFKSAVLLAATEITRCGLYSELCLLDLADFDAGCPYSQNPQRD